MKKNFQKLALILSVIATGMTINSCGGLSSIKNISTNDLLNFATVLTQVNGGSTTTFSGTAKIQKDYATTAGSWQYNPSTGVVSNASYPVSVVVSGTSALSQIIGSMSKKTTTNNSVSITLGDITVEGKTYSNVQLTSVSYDNGNIGDVKNEGYVYSCTYTLNGQTYTTPTNFSSTPYAYVDGTLSSTTGVLSLNIQLVLDASNKIEITYSGTKK